MVITVLVLNLPVNKDKTALELLGVAGSIGTGDGSTLNRYKN